MKLYYMVRFFKSKDEIDCRGYGVKCSMIRPEKESYFLDNNLSISLNIEI